MFCESINKPAGSQETEKELADHRAATRLMQQHSVLDSRQHLLGSRDSIPLLLSSSSPGYSDISGLSDPQQPQTMAEATICKQVRATDQATVIRSIVSVTPAVHYQNLSLTALLNEFQPPSFS